MPKTIVRGHIRKTKKGRVKVKSYKRRQYKALIRNYGVLTSREKQVLEKLQFTEKELAERELRRIEEEERKKIEKHIKLLKERKRIIENFEKAKKKGIQEFEEIRREKAKREWDELTKNK